MEISGIGYESSSFFTLPRSGSINFQELEKEIRKRINTDDTTSTEFIHEGLFILMVSLFKGIGEIENVKFSKTDDGCSIWEMKTSECFLAVFLKEGCLSYSVRVNTQNFQNRMTCCYFSSLHMKADFKSLLNRTMKDFAGLIYECRELTYLFECRDDVIPLGMYHSNGSWFCSEHEEKILTPMHYYEGNIVFPRDHSESPNEYDFIPNDWDTWIHELGHVTKDRFSDVEILGFCLDRCITQFKSYNKLIDLLNPKIKEELELKIKRYKEILHENTDINQ